jgi:hypothetical protein
VRVYDPIVDMSQYPYDSAADRHIARRDIVPDFSGVYQRIVFVGPTPKSGKEILRVVIQQVNSVATVSVYSLVGNNKSLLSGQAIVTGSSFVFTCTEQKNGQPFTNNVITLSLTNPNLLRYTLHRHYLMPGDTRPDQYLVADLPRV